MTDKSSFSSPQRGRSGGGSNKFKNAIKYTNIGFQMLAIILVGVWGGQKLDEWLGFTSLFTVIVSLLSVFAALYVALKDFIRFKK
ncbi:MAG: AtpZ/AtpI family protein [Bacteroidetes bacterium]|nr:AtpZ/AtpI family protein [Bacteroidota bacterium]